MTFIARRGPRTGQVVLVGFAEAMAAIETAWSLQEAGFTVVAFRRSGSRPALRRVPGVGIYEVPAPEQDALATVGALRRLIARVQPAAVLPLDDNAVWLCARLEDAGVPIAGPTGLSAECALDKSMQFRAAERAGLAVPRTQVFEDVPDPDSIDWPVVIKPAHALYEVKGRLVRPTSVVCASGAEFRRAAARSWVPPVVLQPLIRGVGEGLFGHVGAGGVVGWSAHRRIRMVNPQGSASSACRSHPVDQELIAPSERFLKDVGWRGMFMLEFLRDPDGRPWFMELNGRTWGSMALARRRGFEYPAWAVQETLEPGAAVTPPVAPPDVVCRNLGLEFVHLMFVARGPRSTAQMEWPALRQSIREVCRRAPGDHLYNWKRSQPGVLLTDTIGTLGSYLSKATGSRR